MERRSFFSGIAAALGIASDAEANTITLEPKSQADAKIFLVDVTRVDRSEFGKLPGTVIEFVGDHNLPPVMKVPEASSEDVARLVRPSRHEPSVDDERIIRTLREGTRI